MIEAGEVTFVRADDLLEEPVPTDHGPRRGLGWRRQLAGLALAFAGLPLLTLLLRHTRDSLALDGQVLLYLLAVVLVALVGGVAPALVAAVASVVAINYYFVEPLYTLEVAHADQAVALGVFLFVALVVSGAVEVATRRARAARQAAREAETLSGLAGTDLEESDALHAVLERARRTFGMESVVLKARGPAPGQWVDTESAGWGATGEEKPLRFDVPVGELRLVGRGPELFAEDQRVLRAFAAAAQTAYEARKLSTRAGEARDLAAMDRQRTALLAAVGHDLRTPLAGIKAAVGTLRQTDVDWSPRDRDDLLATIEESADRLDGIVANLLDASRLQAGAFSVQARPVALDEVVGAALLAVAGAAEHVSVDVPEDLPLVRADPGLLERVFVNLIDNAVRYGGHAEVSATAGEFSAKVRVSDHGPGVPDDQRDRLFEPFQRLRDRGGSVSGMGLGLSVARGFTEAMGGTLIADRAEHGGLLMRLRVPLAGVDPDAGSAEPEDGA
ncbi:MAG: two-component system, OmpR family, sensor histidine kinase KdpD [Thermoleophilaceae bacterium]|jgi:K+-sensing histidine kinase KdpD|nr:two-component system, OmpR family, sensor histidine kinase KdpD [Thermoleophilaceae bacterium]